jgi:hypothetical protein
MAVTGSRNAAGSTPNGPVSACDCRVFHVPLASTAEPMHYGSRVPSSESMVQTGTVSSLCKWSWQSFIDFQLIVFAAIRSP